jgi:serine/threonine protein kinase
MSLPLPASSAPGVHTATIPGHAWRSRPGTRAGPYEIHSRLSAGGMGEVYHARDTRLDRQGGPQGAAPRAGRPNHTHWSVSTSRPASSPRSTTRTSARSTTSYDVGDHDGMVARASLPRRVPRTAARRLAVSQRSRDRRHARRPVRRRDGLIRSPRGGPPPRSTTLNRAPSARGHEPEVVSVSGAEWLLESGSRALPAGRDARAENSATSRKKTHCTGRHNAGGSARLGGPRFAPRA